MENINIAVSGHINHGKSTLIGRLLYETNSLPQNIIDAIKSGPPGHRKDFAFITDRLAEEQSGGLTIDITQVELKTPQRNYTLIDTPGHKEFLKNMLTGTTKADAAILVIDALEGLLEQTYRYIYLIAMLGIKEVIVVINKMDLQLYNRPRFQELSEKITGFIKKLGMQIITIIPVSAQNGDNITAKSRKMQWSTSPTLIKSLSYISIRKNLAHFPLRFLVQCPYITNGKIKILGKVASGRLLKNHQLTFGPVHHTTNVVSIEISARERLSAEPGESVSLLLEDVSGIEKGQVGFDISSPPLTTDYLVADVFWIGTKPLKSADRIEVFSGTSHCSAQIEKISGIIDPAFPDITSAYPPQLAESQAASVRIKLARSLCVDPLDEVPELGRFAILQDGRITGCGILK